jgi:DNA-binding MarR family transcriptional regulator
MVIDPALRDALQNASEQCVCLHTRMAARAVTRAYDAALAPLGLEATQFTLLGAIAANPTRSVTEMADRLALERTSLSRNLAVLSKRGLILAGSTKGRSVTYAVTEAGQSLLAAALPLWRKVQSSLEGQIGETSWTKMRHSLRQLRQGVAPAAGVKALDHQSIPTYRAGTR